MLHVTHFKLLPKNSCNFELISFILSQKVGKHGTGIRIRIHRTPTNDTYQFGGVS